MKYDRFEQLPVWQAGMTLAERIFILTEDKAFNCKGDLRNQLQRAAISVGNNVAEGFERGTTQELLTFLYIARGSAGEVRSMLLLAERLRGFSHLKSEISDLKSLCESLQNSEIKGTRYLTEKTRRRVKGKKSSEEFFATIDRLVEEGRKSRTAKDTSNPVPPT